MTFINGDVYKGEFVEGNNTQGTTAYADKDNYVGEWENGTYHGHEPYLPNGFKYVGDGKTAIQTARE